MRSFRRDFGTASIWETTTTLRFDGLDALGDAGFHVEATVLELVAKSFTTDFALELLDGAIDVDVAHLDFDGTEFVS